MYRGDKSFQYMSSPTLLLVQGRQVLSVHVVPDPPSTLLPVQGRHGLSAHFVADPPSCTGTGTTCRRTCHPCMGTCLGTCRPCACTETTCTQTIPVLVRGRHVHKLSLGYLTTIVWTESISKNCQSTFVNPLHMNESRTLTYESLYQNILRVLW